ncbi:MAG TPA: hypothetical protein VMV10_13685 [Pirellulales bacterium]|nr:hypothetical protein [Pirellulales bacterium]
MQLRWLASASTSCFHATAAIARGGPLADARLADALASPAASLLGELTAAGLDAEAFFEQAVPLASAFENNCQLADRVLSKLQGPGNHELAAGRLAGWFTQLESAFNHAVPGVVDELELRSGPLREQWEARGPGLLAEIGRQTEPGLLTESAEIVLAYPAVGGAATAHLASNKVVIEAVLANPFGELPEIVRLGWLLSTLNLDLPKYSESIPPERLTRLAKLAMLPVALQSAAELELAPGGPTPLAVAIGAWGLADSQHVDSLAETLRAWRQTYQDNRPPWRVALAALDQMLTTPANQTRAEEKTP